MDRTRRHFIGLAAFGIALGTTRLAGAQPPRILRDDPRGEPVGPRRTSEELVRFVATLETRDVVRHEALTLVWLGGRAAPPVFPIVTLDEARAAGVLDIREQERENVPTLSVDNRGGRHVLLLAGEILLGGKQDRVVMEDVLLPPRSGVRAIAVYCVEAGRWHGASRSFDSKGLLAAPSLRSRVMERAPQQRIWSEVDQLSRRSVPPAAVAPPPGSSYLAMVDRPEMRRQLDQAERAPDLQAIPAARGAAVFVGARLAGVDAFDDATLFAREWPKLLRAYAVEAAAGHAPGKGDALRERADDVIRRAAKAFGTERRNAGVGRLFEFSLDAGRGSALLVEDRVVHLALL
jgi:hypothetical protein